MVIDKIIAHTQDDSEKIEKQETLERILWEKGYEIERGEGLIIVKGQQDEAR